MTTPNDTDAPGCGEASDETLYLLSIPGMRESILEGMALDLAECSQDLDQ